MNEPAGQAPAGQAGGRPGHAFGVVGFVGLGRMGRPMAETLTEINGRGVAMIVIEQNVERGLALADHVAVLEKGRVALAGEPSQMRADERLLSLYVGEAKGNGSSRTPSSIVTVPSSPRDVSPHG